MNFFFFIMVKFVQAQPLSLPFLCDCMGKKGVDSEAKPLANNTNDLYCDKACLLGRYLSF